MTNKKSKKDISEDEEYEDATEIEHILLKPGMYLGPIGLKGREVIMYNVETNRMEKFVIDMPAACEKCIVEILENATDNIKRSLKDNLDPKRIEVKIKGNCISVKNYGRTISLKKRKDGLYNPEFIFSKLRSGSNLNKDGNKSREGSGTNGYGAKLVGIYSLMFCVEVGDSNTGKYFKKTWRDNMGIAEDTIIEKYDGKSFVKVSFELDFKRFGYPKKYVIDDIFINYVRTRCLHLSFTHKIPFMFNKEKYSFDLATYSKLSMKKGTKFVLIEKYEDEQGDYITPKYEICLYYTPDKGRILSFCNGILTDQGGIHVDNVFKAFSAKLIKQINDENKDAGIKLTVRHIKMHISLIVSVHVLDPECTGQMKSKMESPNVPIKISDDIIKKISKWGIIEKLKGNVDDAISTKLIKQTDGKKMKNIGKFKGTKANAAGGKESHLCILYLVEGDSGKGAADLIRSFTKNGTKYIGTFPLKGKLLNPKKCTLKQLAESDEINRLKKVLGLEHGRDYSKDISSLRYGKVRILTDSDDDGHHIAALILNLFHTIFPGILTQKFVELFETPVIRVTLRKTTIPFYTEQEYEEWRKTVDNPDSWKMKYFKGLGTSGPKEIKHDVKKDRVVKFKSDKETDVTMNVAFNTEHADKRKDKILAWKQPRLKEFKESVRISDYLNNKLMIYWQTNLRRSIPYLIDGFKESVRKIFWALWEIFALSNIKVKGTQIKLSQLVSDACKRSDYHKGDKSVEKMIVKMCTNYAGTNNLPLFKGKGDFGNRGEGPSVSAAARYIFTKANEWVRYVFRKEDLEILSYNKGDNKEFVEPKFYLPIIPMVLLNGAKGVACGWSTTIPAHNPYDLIDHMEKLITEKKPKKLKPFYIHFTGNIKSNEKGFSTIGNFERKGNVIKITELPIGVWNKNYENDFIIDELEEKKIISGYNDNCVVDKKTFIDIVDFELKFKDSELAANQTTKSLRLISKFSYENMYLLNSDGIPTKFDTVEDIAYNFYINRLDFYYIRKEHQMKKIKEEIQKLTDKIRLIKLILNKTIIIMNRLRQDIYDEVESHSISKEIYMELKATCLSKDDIRRYKEKIDKLNQELEEISNKDPKDIWLGELSEFRDYLDKNYKCF